MAQGTIVHKTIFGRIERTTLTSTGEYPSRALGTLFQNNMRRKITAVDSRPPIVELALQLADMTTENLSTKELVNRARQVLSEASRPLRDKSNLHRA